MYKFWNGNVDDLEAGQWLKARAGTEEGGVAWFYFYIVGVDCEDYFVVSIYSDTQEEPQYTYDGYRREFFMTRDVEVIDSVPDFYKYGV